MKNKLPFPVKSDKQRLAYIIKAFKKVKNCEWPQLYKVNFNIYSSYLNNGISGKTLTPRQAIDYAIWLDSMSY